MVGQTRRSNPFRLAGTGKALLSEPRITLAIPNEPSKLLKTKDRTFEGVSIFGRTPNLDEKIQIQVYYR